MFNLRKIIKKVVAAPIRIVNAPLRIIESLTDEDKEERSLSEPGEGLAKGVENAVEDIIGKDEE